MGGNFLIKYLGIKGDKSDIKAGVVLSAPIDLIVSMKFLQRSSPSSMLADYILAKYVKEYIMSNYD